MYTIFLDNIKLKGYHGVYEEEAVAGNDFEVSVHVTMYAQQIDSISDTINYAQVYEILKKSFSTPHKLLETLAVEILEEVKNLHEGIKRISISIAKLNSPIAQFNGRVGVSYVRDF